MRVAGYPNLELDGVMQAPGKAGRRPSGPLLSPSGPGPEVRRTQDPEGAAPVEELLAAHGLHSVGRGHAQEEGRQAPCACSEEGVVRSLNRRNLVDEFVLLIHPFVPGDGTPPLRRGQTSASPAGTQQGDRQGGAVASYRPTEPAQKAARSVRQQRPRVDLNITA
jgi:hypothetical protein